MNLEHIKKVDTLVAEQIEKEFERQQNTIELIASENITSQAVMEACGSVLTNKYAEGKPHKRFYNGCDCVDVIFVFLNVLYKFFFCNKPHPVSNFFKTSYFYALIIFNSFYKLPCLQ